MRSTSPQFDAWRQLASLRIFDVAALMQGFDPRAIADVAVRDPDDPTSPHGVSPDLSWEIKRLISAVNAGQLVTAPTGVVAPNDETEILKTSLVSWLRAQGEVFLADELDTLSQTNGLTVVASAVPSNGTNIVWTPDRILAAKKMLLDEKGRGTKNFAAKTADAFGVSGSRLREVIGDKPKKESAKSTASPWGQSP